jgi:cell volume regulation protein A
MRCLRMNLAPLRLDRAPLSSHAGLREDGEERKQGAERVCVACCGTKRMATLLASFTTALEHRLLLAGGILLLGVIAAVLARRLSLPVLVLFLGIGMLLGSDGLGGFYFDNAQLARELGVVALIAILFEGGLTTSWHDLRPLALPAFLLSTVGVVVTAAVVGVVAHELLHLAWVASFLLGAVVGSTDAAAVFATLRFTTVHRRLASLLGAESGINDPMAVALTIGLIAWLTKPGYGAGDMAVLLVRQLGLGLVIGLALGVVARRLLPRLPLDLSPFAPVTSIAFAAFAYGLADAAGGSGFLAVYLVALWIGNTTTPHRRTIVSFHEGLAFTAQVGLFVVFGLLVFPGDLGGVAAASIALTAVLVLVARPLAVFVSLPFLGFSLREKLFMSWAGLRGGVPIVLATFALSRGLHESDTIFNAVFFVVVLSALVQGPALGPIARRLGLAAERRPFYREPLEVGAVRELGAEIVEHLVEEGDALVGLRVRDTGLPRDALVMLIVRDGVGVPPRGRTLLEAGDVLYVLASEGSRPAIEELFDRWKVAPVG